MATIDRPIRRLSAARRARRRHQRGTALVETAFMLPMFVILWYGSLYVHSLGSKYIQVNSDARADAWQTAMANCGVHHDEETEKLPAALGGGTGLAGSGGAGSSSAVSTALKNGNSAGALSGFVNTFTSILSSVFPNPNGSTVLKTQTISWREPDLYDHSGMSPKSTTVKGTTTVVCNEAPMNGSISNVISGVVSLIKSII